MAYAAVLSLSQILEHISNPHLQQHQTPLQDQHIKCLQEKLDFLLDFLDDSLQRRSKEVQCLETEIRDAAYKAEDIMESHISKNFGQEGFQERQMRDQSFCVNFEMVADEINSIKTKAAKLKKLWVSTDLHQSERTSLQTGPSRLPPIGKNDMVGFGKDLTEIMDQLTGYPDALQIIPVAGMGGIGKTTLALNVYNDPLIEHHFDTRAWASVSQVYSEREVLLCLLDSMKQNSAEMRQENDTEKLKDKLYKSLKRMRYLVVMDDVWTTEAWDSLRRIFPDDGNGSRIMFTTRLLSVADSCSSPHHMEFLNETDSWILLRQKVFGEDSCPLELEEAGKEIAENCKGLPLSLSVVGGHLSKANRTKDHWEYVAKNFKSVLNAPDANCSEILSLSYDYLPHYLKACFLYMGVFPEDDKIRISKLTKLWAAERFLKPVRHKTLEEVAEEYLADLISRNLILISEKSYSGKIKTCRIHDLLRDLCIRKAQQEKFFHVTDKDVNIFAEGIEYSRRLCISPDIFRQELSNSDNSNVNLSIGSLPPVRSVLRSGFDDICESGYGKLFPLLRVLDLAKGKVDGFPIGEIKLVHSRYIAFSYDGKISIPKILPDFLWYLQTLIVDCDDVHLPKEIWRMPQLRHLLFGKCYLSCSARSPIDGENLVLGNLVTLSRLDTCSCTKEVFERVPNLKKLGIMGLGMTSFSLGNLVNLPELEKLKIMCSDVSVPMNFTFPPNIKKLTLVFCKIPWKHMTIVGSMPNLEVLTLKRDAFDGPEWEPTEGEFCKLKFLRLEQLHLKQWRADKTHFPGLECLIIWGCFNLEEIPSSIGDIPTLKIIDLDDASPSAVTSVGQIQEEQENLGNDSLKVLVRLVLQSLDQERMKAEAEIIGGSNDDLLLKATIQFFNSSYATWEDANKEIMPEVVSRLLEFLNRDDYPRLQCEAARALKRISHYSPVNINTLIDHGVIPILVSLLRSPKDDLRKQAIEMLGYMALDSPRSRDFIRSHGVFITLMALVNDKTELSIMRSAVKTLSIFFDTRPQFEFELEQVKPALYPLVLLIHTGDEEVINHACHVINYLISKRKDIIQAVIDAGVFPRLIVVLQYPSRSVLNYALRIVANIIQYGDDILIQVVIENWNLFCPVNLLTQDYDNDVKVGTCFIIAKIITRTKDNFQVVSDAGIVSPLFQLLQNDVFEIQGAAASAIYDVTTKGTNEQIKFLVHEGCIKPLCDLLVNPNDVHITGMCLACLGNILQVGEAERNQGNTEDVNVFAKMIDDAGGLQKIKNLRTHDDSIICQMAVWILETYWQEEDDEQPRKEAEAEIIGGLNDDLLLEATKRFRISFLRDKNKEIMPGVVSRLLEFLNRDDYPRLQCEAARALKSISKYSPDNINMLIDHGVIPILASLLRSSKDDLRKRAIKMLGYMARGSPRSRDLIHSHGVFITLMAQVNDKTELSILRSAVKTLSIFCHRDPWPQFEFEQVKPALYPLVLLIHTGDEEVIQNACHVIYYLTDEREDIIQVVIDAGVFPRLIVLLQYPSRSVLYYALRIVANIIQYGDDILIQVVIDAGIVSLLVQLLQNDVFEIQRAAAFTIYRATIKGTNEQIKFLVHEGCIKPFCDLLVNPNDVNITGMCLAGLENILKVGEDEKNPGNTGDVNVFAKMIDDAGGLQKIKNLQTHDDSRICEMAVRILETYWQEEDDEKLPTGDAP